MSNNFIDDVFKQNFMLQICEETGFFVLLHMQEHRYQNPARIPTAQLDMDESFVTLLYLPH